MVPFCNTEEKGGHFSKMQTFGLFITSACFLLLSRNINIILKSGKGETKLYSLTGTTAGAGEVFAFPLSQRCHQLVLQPPAETSFFFSFLTEVSAPPPPRLPMQETQQCKASGITITASGYLFQNNIFEHLSN